jgi:hypothetical protein
MRLAGGAEEIDQRLKLAVGQMAELPLVAFAHGLVELFQEC